MQSLLKINFALKIIIVLIHQYQQWSSLLYNMLSL